MTLVRLFLQNQKIITLLLPYASDGSININHSLKFIFIDRYHDPFNPQVRQINTSPIFNVALPDTGTINTFINSRY